MGDLLAEQARYYRERAPEYDDWWFRRGRFDRGEEENARWFADAAALEAELERFGPSGDVLELACGTGLWTRHLALRAGTLTAVDASREVIAINRERVPRPELVEYVEADLFAWRPERAYDAVFFGFWLSHVPEARFDAFWEMVRSALRPGGRVLFFDSALPGPDGPPEGETMTRRLADGRAFRIVKRLHDPAELEARLAAIGWDVRVTRTGHHFIVGTGG